MMGVDSRSISPRELTRIGYVSESQDLPERLTVEQYLDYLRPFYPQWDRDLEAATLSLLHLPPRRKIGDLSHGMRMKMALACALPFHPKLLVLDEPFSGLDPLVRDEFMESLIQQAAEMTVLISSHELSEIDHFATHVGFYVIRVPRNLYARIADQSVRLEIDYYLTLLKLSDTQKLPATGGDQRTRGLGWCGTRISEAGGEILAGCIEAGPAPSCSTAVLEDIPSGAHNPPIGICVRPDYSPFGFRYGPDALSRFTETLPFGNPAGVDTYPVKETMLPESRVKLKMYEAEDHFERRLSIPRIRLRDWAAAE